MILIRNGTVVNESCSFAADVFIHNGIIKKIGKDFNVPENTRIIDATGKLLLPGGIDSYCQLEILRNNMKSADDFYSGSKAALAGGTTTIFNCVDSSDSTLIEEFQSCQNEASANICCNYGLIVEVPSTGSNVEEEMQILTTKGVNMFKLSLASRTATDEYLLKSFHTCMKLGALPVVHAENGDIIRFNEEMLIKSAKYGPEGHLYSRPEEVEEEATNRAIALAHSCNAPILIANCTSKLAARVIAKKREQGCQAYGQPLTAALVTDGHHYLDEDWAHAAAYVVSPPLRLDPETPTHLLQMLASGNLQVTGSGHCTYNLSQKAIGVDDFTKIPSGVNGVEDRLSLIWDKAVRSGMMDQNSFVAVTSSNAAKMFNIYPSKGRIDVGSDADIVVWDPEGKKVISSTTHFSAVDFNIFEGTEVQGIPQYVLLNGKVVVEENCVDVDRGEGKFISANPFSPYVFSRLKNVKVPSPIDRPPIKSGPKEEVDEKETTQHSRPEFHPRPPTKAGGRNLQDSTFSLSGTQIDENIWKTTGVKGVKPPGDSSTRPW